MSVPVSPSLPLGALLKPTKETKKLTKALKRSTPRISAEVPAAVDLLSNLGPLRHQGARGTCLSFAATALHEYNYRPNHSAKDFSEQFLYARIKSIDSHAGVCRTWLAYAIKALNDLGQCSRQTWSYNPNLPCNDTSPEPTGADAEALNFRMQARMLSAKSVRQIKGALISNSVVPISIPVYDSWYKSPEFHRTGRITMTVGNEPVVSSHCVCVAGFQNIYDWPGGGCFIFRNSWGTGWAPDSPYSAGN